MKNFIRSLPGKTLVFLLAVIMITVFALSVFGIILTTSAGINFYLTTEEAICAQVDRDILFPWGYRIVYAAADIEENGGETVTPLGITDLEFSVVSPDGKTLFSSGFNGSAKKAYTYRYAVERDSSGAIISVYSNDGEFTELNESYYTVSLVPVDGSEISAKVSVAENMVHVLYTLRYHLIAIVLISLILLIVLYITLMAASARRPKSEELTPGPLHKVPFDLLFVLSALVPVFLTVASEEFGFFDEINILEIAVVLGIGIVTVCIFLGLSMSCAARIKAGTLIKNTVIYMVLKGIFLILRFIRNILIRIRDFFFNIIKNIPLVPKTVIGIVAVALIRFLFAAGFDGQEDVTAFYLIIEGIILSIFFIYVAVCLAKLKKSGKALAEGDLTHVTDTKGMMLDLRKHGECLNSIADGMKLAVDRQMKSERMKTELITNVSHDLKTPLTSVINYASLIENEPTENKKITEYSQVLVRQSGNLKRLIDDLVEASKAQTGNLDVNPAPCDASVFVTQAAGEYEERLKNADLSLVVSSPEKELTISADGRRMWRIFDNLMNNIVKYAQPGTRVYLSLEERGKNAVFTFRNTSREPLNISEEELMERFVRGDSSRNTEGNGLGISIAKSMAELQGGKLDLVIDGDLFKAILTFPMIKNTHK